MYILATNVARFPVVLTLRDNDRCIFYVVSKQFARNFSVVIIGGKPTLTRKIHVFSGLRVLNCYLFCQEGCFG